MSGARAVVSIKNKKGLHARAAAKFVKVVTAYHAQVEVCRYGEEDAAVVSGSSILGLMMLGADAGSELLIQAEGEQAGEVIKALKELLDGKFGEEE